MGVSYGRTHHVDLRGERRRDLARADSGQRFGDGRVRRQDDRLAGHDSAGGVVGVGEQAADRGGFLRLHELQQALGFLGGQIAQQVGRIVRAHRLEDVGGALVLQPAEQLDLLVLRELLEHGSQALVVQRGGDLGAALVGQVVQHRREVGRA